MADGEIDLRGMNSDVKFPFNDFLANGDLLAILKWDPRQTTIQGLTAGLLRNAKFNEKHIQFMCSFLQASGTSIDIDISQFYNNNIKTGVNGIYQKPSEDLSSESRILVVTNEAKGEIIVDGSIVQRFSLQVSHKPTFYFGDPPINFNYQSESNPYGSANYNADILITPDGTWKKVNNLKVSKIIIPAFLKLLLRSFTMCFNSGKNEFQEIKHAVDIGYRLLKESTSNSKLALYMSKESAQDFNLWGSGVTLKEIEAALAKSGREDDIDGDAQRFAISTYNESIVMKHFIRELKQDRDQQQAGVTDSETF